VFDRDLYIAMHAGWEPTAFQIPESPSGRPWRRAVDTGLPSPDDVAGPDEGPRVAALGRYGLRPRSMVVLVSEA
jgi:glycogen operon protein